MSEELMIKVPQSRYSQLIKDQETLNKLYAGGVENWEWYGDCFDGEEDED